MPLHNLYDGGMQVTDNSYYLQNNEEVLWLCQITDTF